MRLWEPQPGGPPYAGTPEDVAGTVAYLVSDEAQYMTGQVISISGGLTMV